MKYVHVWEQDTSFLHKPPEFLMYIIDFVRPSLDDLILIVLVVLIIITLLEEEPRLLLLLVSLAIDLLPVCLFVVVVRVESLGKKS